MSSGILSALADEHVLHANSLATVTENWIVVRESHANAHALVAIERLEAVRTQKTSPVVSVAFSLGCFLVAAAAQCSNEGEGSAPYIAAVGLILLVSAAVSRKASLAFISGEDVVPTVFGSLREAATIVATVQSVQGARQKGIVARPPRYAWVRAYLALLV